ncbi:hypothetical protein ACYFX5_12205 [Bremerella sp. T1]|uniref:hypothetical protein n=1 Tax=Bremerella sp. TYQ1 TaxID=3119568 RepID=UPI001CCFA601|nr:hypothetical protein [Bremerella volcania]UBM33835.1 hypothetical protein LA756_14150 [Bremerella volcania]
MRIANYCLILLGVVLLSVGCSGGNGLETAPAEGVVTYNGKPLPYGRVSFRPEAGSPATGEIQDDGTFTLSTYGTGDGAIVGTHQVSISATERDAGLEGEINPNAELPVSKSVIPKKYSSFSTSELTVEVVASGPNQFTLELND